MTEGVIVARTIPVPRRRRVVGRLAEQPIVWLLPLAALLLVSYVYPAIDVVRFSFTNATLLNPEYEYTLQSYSNVSANRDLPIILQNTLIFVVASVFFQLLLGLLVALALNRGAKRGLPGVTFIRIVILASWIVPGVSAGIVWQLMFNEASYGFLNGVLRLMGLPTCTGSPTRASRSGPPCSPMSGAAPRSA
jgi:multiple sugar transport system permease protein